MTDTLEIEIEKQRRLYQLDVARTIIDSELQEMYRRLATSAAHSIIEDAVSDLVGGKAQAASCADLLDAMDEAETSLIDAVFEEFQSAIMSHFDTLAEAAADA